MKLFQYPLVLIFLNFINFVDCYAQNQAAPVWIMLDYNNQSGEVKEARTLAQKSGSELKVFSNTNEFQSWMKENQKSSNQSIDTLIISGHAMGSEFFNGLSATQLSSMANENEALKKTKAIYALGCYTVTSENARLWASTLPELRYVAGFDGAGPSHDPSVEFLREMEKARAKLVPQKTPEELKSSLSRAFKYKGKWATHAAVGVIDQESEQMKYISGSPNPSVDKGVAVLDLGLKQLEECDESILEFKEALGEESSLTSLLSNQFNGGSPPNCSELKELPKVHDSNSSLRKLYSQIQKLGICTQDVVTADESIIKRMNDQKNSIGIILGTESFESGAFQMGRLKLITFIHQDQIMKNFMECSAPFLGQLKKRAEACLEPEESAKIITSINSQPVTRQSVCRFLNNLSQHEEWNGVTDMLIPSLFEQSDPWVTGEAELWDPINQENRENVCGSMMLNDATLLKNLDNRSKFEDWESSFGRCRGLSDVFAYKRRYHDQHKDDYVEYIANWESKLFDSDYQSYWNTNVYSPSFSPIGFDESRHYHHE